MKELTVKDLELREVQDNLESHLNLEQARKFVALTSPGNSRTAFPRREPVNNAIESHSSLRAEIANLKNCLTRAEADSFFLSKTVRLALKYHGKIPDVMLTEVKRICKRIETDKSSSSTHNQIVHPISSLARE